MEKPSIVQQLATQLLSKDTPHPKRLVIIAQLNRHFLEAPTFEKCAADVEQLPQGVLPLVFSLVSSGEPHVYLALNLLHFACFAPSHRTNLLRLKAAPFLAGLLRAGGEHELCRAALSLLVTVGQGEEGRQHIGNSNGLAKLAAKYLRHDSAELRDLAIQLLRALLWSANGRKQACSSAASLEDAAQEAKKKSTGNQQRELDSILRELAIYEKRLKTAAYQ
ncbi:hypothetical protein CYMTET_36094 [Cymbomonas tetramitiformis]|uniref:Uncharacterized protein n=1 Tax=Cymbomonas tetramitiformis TaxID=36881 RepID=A0AAE0F7X3_9CHLO|nr:hypothetical protein CYMTET_36094 [Cymbomonas tetramitiformis]